MKRIELFSLFLDSFSTLLAAVAILLYVLIWKNDKITNSYESFDSLYMEILKVGIENPHLRNDSLTSNYNTLFKGKDLIQYNTYAFMSFNFIETVYDRGDNELLETWFGVLETEFLLHRKWFLIPQNQRKFKEEFRSFVLLKFESKFSEPIH